MSLGNLKPVIVAVSTAFSALIYTKKRIRKQSKLKAIHSKTNDGEKSFIKKN